MRTVLFRDPTDDRYPYHKDAKGDLIKDRRWNFRIVEEVHPRGLIVILEDKLALVNPDGTWDIAEQVNAAKVSSWEDTWGTVTRTSSRRRSYVVAWLISGENSRTN